MLDFFLSEYNISLQNTAQSELLVYFGAIQFCVKVSKPVSN